LPSRIKVISYAIDLHFWHDIEYQKQITKSIFQRADLILCPYREVFDYLYPEFINKRIFFPKFVNKERYLRVGFNNNPKNKFLLIGCPAKEFYPLRYKFANCKHYAIDIMPHPGYYCDNIIDNKVYYIGDDYAKKLNEYFSIIITHSKEKYLLTKYFEAAASGALLFGEDLIDARNIGFNSGENCILFDKKDNNVLTKISKMHFNWKYYTQIRQQGQSMVLSNHTDDVRVENFKKCLSLL